MAAATKIVWTAKQVYAMFVTLAADKLPVTAIQHGGKSKRFEKLAAQLAAHPDFEHVKHLLTERKLENKFATVLVPIAEGTWMCPGGTGGVGYVDMESIREFAQKLRDAGEAREQKKTNVRNQTLLLSNKTQEFKKDRWKGIVRGLQGRWSILLSKGTVSKHDLIWLLLH